MTLNAHNRHKRFIRIVVLSFFKMSSRQMLQVISCCQNGNVFLICSFHRTLHYYEKISNISTITMNVLQYLEGWDIGATAADINPPLRLG